MKFVKTRPELCRVIVRDAHFSFPKRYPLLIRPNPLAQKEGVAGYEIALDANAVPIQLTPRAASELKWKSRYQLFSVNAPEQQRNPCRKLVTRRGSEWELTNQGIKFLDLLTQWTVSVTFVLSH